MYYLLEHVKLFLTILFNDFNKLVEVLYWLKFIQIFNQNYLNRNEVNKNNVLFIKDNFFYV